MAGYMRVDIARYMFVDMVGCSAVNTSYACVYFCDCLCDGAFGALCPFT